MPTGRCATAGIGVETTWGVSVAPTLFFDAVTQMGEERDRIYDPHTFGQEAQMPPDAGRLRIQGKTFGDVPLRPALTRLLLRLAFGNPTRTGSGTFTDVYTWGGACNYFAPGVPKVPFTFFEKLTADDITRYSGGQLTNLELRQDAAGQMLANATAHFKGAADASDTAVSKENAAKFLYRHLEIERSAAAYNRARDVTIAYNADIVPDELLDGSDEASAFETGENPQFTINMTLDFRERNTFLDFRNNTINAWSYEWTRDADNSLLIEVPKLVIESWGKSRSNAGMLSVPVSARAAFDIAENYAVRITHVNQVAA
jgi:hypothetical protein